MNIKALLNDDDAVSPVIGVILMVAITVILAAVIASFVLGLGDQNNPAPTADFDFDYNSGSSNYVVVTHGNGDALDPTNVYVRGQGLSSASVEGTSYSSSNHLNDYGSYGSEFSAGQSFNVTSVSSDYVINVVWEDPDSDSTSTLSTDEGPDA